MGAALIGATLLAGCGKEVTEEVALETDAQKASYGLGMRIGGDLERSAGTIDKDALIAGIADKLDGKEVRLTDEDISAAFQAVRQQEMEKRKLEADENLKTGQEFLAKALERPEVNKVEGSEVLFEILRDAKGEKPTLEDQVTVHYVGTLIDGTEFDSSVSRGKPSTFGLQRLIKGWQQAIPQMTVGSKWKLYIPSDLAYGAQSKPTIPANSALIFEIELIEIVKNETASAESK